MKRSCISGKCLPGHNREIFPDARACDADTLMVLATQEVADLTEFTGKTIQFRVEAEYGQEQYDIILL